MSMLSDYKRIIEKPMIESYEATIAAQRAEIARLREAISGVIVVANSGALKEFDGEPWLARVLATQL